MRSNRQRYIIVYCLIFLLFVPIYYRLLDLQLFDRDNLIKIAQRQHNLKIEVPPRRGYIYDRNHNELATSLKVSSIYLVPRLIYEKEKYAQTLADILDLEYSYVYERITRDKMFVWLKRKISQEEEKRIRELRDPNIAIIYENKRFYPHNELLSHVIGFCDIDNKGIEGIELTLNEYLRGKEGYQYTKRDARGRRLIALEDIFIPPVHGYDVYLTIDQYIQYIVETELNDAVKQWKPKGAAVIVMNCHTGEILAIANRPTYNLNTFSDSDESARRNRAITDIYEPGSVFKIVTAAAALEEEVMTLNDTIFCENGEYRALPGRILHDVHPYGMLDFASVLIKSSNIGTVKIAEKLGEKKLYHYIRQFGFGEKTLIDLPGEVGGMLRPPSEWSKYSITSIPMGQEVAATAIQVVTAMAVIANGGSLVTPYVIDEIKDSQQVTIKNFEPLIKRTFMHEDVAKKMQKILVRVVEEGTGQRAKIEGVPVGGKTGTAQKILPDGSGYSHSDFFSSFIGFFPADEPQFAMVVMLDEPGPRYYGGTVAAPVFKNVAEKTLNYLGYIKKDDDEKKI